MWAQKFTNSPEETLQGDENVLKLDCNNGGINLLKIIELYSYNGSILWYVNYTSIKLFNKKVGKGTFCDLKKNQCKTVIIWKGINLDI